MKEAAGARGTPMLRTLVLALALAWPGLAAAEDFPHAVVGSEVRGEGGVVIGHVSAVQRDRHGNIIAVEIPGAEPPDASMVLPGVVASNSDQRALRVLVNDRRNRARDDNVVSPDRARLR